eukprot:13950150-Alexandrium_andersonii.AAC.1
MLRWRRLLRAAREACWRERLDVMLLRLRLLREAREVARRERLDVMLLRRQLLRRQVHGMRLRLQRRRVPRGAFR